MTELSGGCGIADVELTADVASNEEDDDEGIPLPALVVEAAEGLERLEEREAALLEGLPPLRSMPKSKAAPGLSNLSPLSSSLRFLRGNCAGVGLDVDASGPFSPPMLPPSSVTCCDDDVGGGGGGGGCCC